MRLSTVNISKMATDRVNIIIAINYEVIYGLLIGIFGFDHAHFKNQGQGCAHIDSEYLKKDDM